MSNTETIHLLNLFERYLDAKTSHDAVERIVGTGPQLSQQAVYLAHARIELAAAIDRRFGLPRRKTARTE